MQELRFAIRRLRNSPGFTAAAVLTLALGIGANTAIFSVLYAGFFAPYALDEPERLLRLQGEDPKGHLTQLELSVPKFDLARAEQRVFTALDAANYTSVTLLGTGEAAQVDGAWVTPGFLKTLGARPRLGRFFDPGEDQRADLAVISETLWRSRFAADPDIVGRPLRMAGAVATIIGIAPRLPAFWQAEVFRTGPSLEPAMPRETQQRGYSFLTSVGRLKPGVTREQAAADLERVAALYREQRGENADASWALVGVGLRDDIVGGSRAALFMMLGAVGLVLLLACSNVANLLLVRFAASRREIAVCGALGASRARIIGQCLLESLAISVLAAIAGSWLAALSLPALTRLAADFLPFSQEIDVHLPVLVVTFCVAAVTGLATAAYPAAQASRSDLVAALHEGSRGAAGGRAQSRVRNLLVSAQVAVSMLLLVGACLLVASLARLYAQPPGFHADGVFTAGVTLPVTRYPDAETQGRFYLRLAEELRQAPGVRRAALTQSVPMGGSDSRSPYARVDGAVPPLKDRPLGLTRSVTPGYFATLEIPLLAGRDFTERDTEMAPLVVVLSRDTARKLFPSGDALGRHVIMGSKDGGLEMEVVGIVGDVRSETLAETPDVEFYRPVMQRNLTFIQFAVRTEADAAAFASTARSIVRRLDPELALTAPGTLTEVISRSLGRQRLLVRLVGLFAVLALALAVVGIYSVVAYAVRQRSRDLGIRLALGARPADVVGLTIGQGLVPVAAGIAVGLAGCLAVGRLIQSQLYGVSAFDPITLAGSGLALAAVATLACYLPARRAARLDPAVTLRAD